MILARIGWIFAMIAAGPALADRQLSIATAGTGGVYYPMGGGMAEIIGQAVPGYSATAEVTGGSVENMGLVARGDADLAIALADTVRQAYRGTDRFQGQPLGMLRSLLGLYSNLVQIVTLDENGIGSLSDFRDRRISVGAPGSGTEVNARAILQSAGLDYSTIQAQRLNFNETADALRNGDIDAGFWSVAAPTSSILNLAANRGIRLIELSETETEKALSLNPSFHRAVIAGGTYPGLGGDVSVLGVPNVLVVSADMPQELAYAICRALFENLDRLIAVHPAARQISTQYTVQSVPVPLHPGAVQYLEEIGVKIPKRIQP